MKKPQKIPPTHPGEILLHDFLVPLGVSRYALAKAIGVTPIRISQIVRGQRAVTADTALRLARYFGTSPGIWQRLQAQYDLEIAAARSGKQIERQVKAHHFTPRRS